MLNLPQMPKVNAKHPRIVVNAAALTNLVYTGMSVVQDMAAGHFTSDDKVFVASFLVGLVALLVPLYGGAVEGESAGPAPVVVEAAQDPKQS
jgi:hypothetical protein